MTKRRKNAAPDQSAQPPDEVLQTPDTPDTETPLECEADTAPDQAESTAQPEQPETAAQEAPSAEDPALAALREEARKAAAERDEYLTLAQRVQADFDNYRRHNKSARAESFEEGARAYIKTVLPVLDNLDRALSVESADEKLAEGVRMVRRQLWDTLEKRGVSVISRLGEKFDPNLENAVMQGEAEEGEPGTVCAVFQTGYRMGEFVLRHAMVRVVAEA